MNASRGFILGALCMGALGIAAPSSSHVTEAVRMVREAITVHVGDTIVPRFSVWTDSILGVAPGKIIPKKCGTSRAFLRLWRGTTMLSADSVTVNVTAPCTVEVPVPPPPTVASVSICFMDTAVARQLHISGDTTIDPSLLPPGTCKATDTLMAPTSGPSLLQRSASR